MLSAYCNLDAGDRASLARGTPEDLHCIVVDTFPFCLMSALGLGHRSREEETLRDQIFAST